MRLSFIVAAVIAAAPLCSQTIEGIPQMDWDGVGPLPTIEGDLQRAGHASTEEALVAALRDPRPTVRSLAAQKIAKEGWKDAAPSVLSAFSSEKALGTRLWLANALAKLGEGKGVEEIVRTCNTATLPVDFRLAAAQFALESRSAGCNDMVIDALYTALGHETGLQPEREMNEVGYIYSMLNGRAAQFKERSAEIRQRLEESLADNLEDSLASYRATLRMAAANALATFGDSGSLEKLRQALAAETNHAVQQRMRAAVEQLEKTEKGSGAGQQ
jgi:HEAT repeat protein